MNKTIYALGFFDGVHIGHAALLRTCRDLAATENCRCGAVTFDTHPASLVLRQAPVLINSVRDRELLLREQFHMDRVVTLTFDEKLRSMDWRDFLDMLCRDYGAAGFVCGDDFRFGYKGQGTTVHLEGYCGERGLPCRVVPEQTLDGIRVYSPGYGGSRPQAGQNAGLSHGQSAADSRSGGAEIRCLCLPVPD